MPDGGVSESSRNRPGETALSMGIVAVVFSFVPIVGDLVAAPVGVLAVVLGAIGIRRTERGGATNFGQSLTGATLGALAVCVVLLILAITR